MHCKQCNSEFVPKIAKQVYCSESCRELKNKYVKKGFGETSCTSCKKLFARTNVNQKYCSDQCKADIPTYTKLDLGIRCCDVCGQPFRKGTANQRFCSEPCRLATTGYVLKWPRTRFCLQCGFVFSAQSPFHCFCQTSCRFEYKRRDQNSHLVSRTCQVCKNKFRGTDKQEYCGKACASASASQPSHFILFQRDEFKCSICKKGPISHSGIVLELLKLVRDEASVAANLFTCCKGCSQSRDLSITKKTLEEKNILNYINSNLQVRLKD